MILKTDTICDVELCNSYFVMYLINSLRPSDAYMRR